jgi:hypothetical protein
LPIGKNGAAAFWPTPRARIAAAKAARIMKMSSFCIFGMTIAAPAFWLSGNSLYHTGNPGIL